jgi:RNA polymerase sigma factor (sigma-70 family)
MPCETSVSHPLPPGPTPTADGALSPPPAPEADDQILIRRVAARDPHAFEQLYQRYARRLRGYLRRLLPRQVLPEDVLTEVMLLVWHQAARCDPSKPLVAWLFGVARHKALEARRAARTRPTPPPAAAESVADALEIRVADQELARTVTQALAALPPAERQVVELTYYYDLSYPEIAALVGCPVNTVKTRMARARQRLAPQLNALGLTRAPDLAAHHPPQDPGGTARVQPPRRAGL